MFKKEKNCKIGLIIIFLIALFLRLFKLSDFPAGFTPDEASQGYTAYSILKTGSDEWGVRFPLNPRSFGDFKSPLQTYLMIPSVSVFSLNEFAVRLPNALLGSLSVLIVYFLALELAKVGKIEENTKFSLVSALLVAFSPWHISLSRGAFEANLSTFFLPLAILFFLKGVRSNLPSIHNSLFIILSSFVFGLNLFSYHSAKIVTPLILFFLLVWQRENLKNAFKKKALWFYLSAIVLGGLFFLQIMGFLQGAGARAGDIGIFSGGWQAVADLRFFAVKEGLPDIVSRIFNNKLTFVWGEFVKNYFSYLSPQFLFTQGAGEATYGMIPGFGVLYLFEVIFVLWALYFLIKEKHQVLIFLFFWILISPFSASLARGVGYHANRVAVMMPAIQIFSGFGAVKFLQWSKDLFKKNFGIVKLFYCLIVAFSFMFFLEKYFFYAPKVNAEKMGYGWSQVTPLLNINQPVIISRSLSEPQAYVMFFLKLDPNFAQQETPKWMAYSQEGKNFVDQLGEYRLGNFTFRNFSFPEDWQGKATLLVGPEKDFYGQDLSFYKVNKINYPDGKTAMIVIQK